MPEIWDLYDKNRNLTGRDHIRGEIIPDGCYHLVVHVWIKSPDGRFLVSQRAADRKSYPLMWETTGGSVIKGETSLEGALRETKEELGIDLDPSRGRLVFSEVRGYVNGERYADILDVWLFEYNGGAKLDQATTKEVNAAALLDRDGIQKLFDEEKFVGTLDYFFTRIAD